MDTQLRLSRDVKEGSPLIQGSHRLRTGVGKQDRPAALEGDLR